MDNSSDIALQMVQKVLDYIQNILVEPQPQTEKLTRMFGTKEFALKDNFRNLQKTLKSIMQLFLGMSYYKDSYNKKTPPGRCFKTNQVIN